MKKYMLFISLFVITHSKAQTENPLTITGYIETYYTYDFNTPQNHTRPNFIYSHNKHNELNINLGFIKAAYQKNNVRGNMAFATGTYMNANYASEPGVLKNIFEANAGIKISKQKNLWIDAGIFASHIGFESAISKDCWNLTRSILADNSPYYESGIKLSYTSNNNKWFLSGLLLNGWQKIQRIEGNNTIAFGHQLTYKPNSKTTLNSSSFIGNDKPDSTKQMRYFHNLYGIFQLNNRWSIIAGFDAGAEQRSKKSNDYNTWYAPIVIVKYTYNNNSIAARIEYYNDNNGVLITSANSFKTWGYSINYDYNVSNNAVWRIEARNLSSTNAIFLKNNTLVQQNFFITSSIALTF